MTDWQPIETAPKDGEEVNILLFGGVLDSAEDYWPDFIGPVVAYWDCGMWVIAPTGSEKIMVNNPTHWMPLPEPPND